MSEGTKARTRGFFDDYPRFLETSATSAIATRLNRRHQAIIERNRDMIEGKVVLDLASHDGRWSFAALQAGASKVIGVEARRHLVDNARATFEEYGIDRDRYDFICGDLFDVFDRDLGPIDTVFCLGIFYHINRHDELVCKIRETGARFVLVDTNVCLSDRPIVELRREDTRVEGAAAEDTDTIDHWKVTGLPSVPALELLFNHGGFAVEPVDWSSIIEDGDAGVGQYRNGQRVTMRGTREDSAMSKFAFQQAAAGEFGVLVRSDTGQSITDVDMDEVRRGFTTMNLLLFRGFDIDIPRFREFTDAMCDGFVSYAGGAAVRDFVGNDPTVLTVSEKNHTYPVPLHGEMYYIKQRPEVLFFYCKKPVAEGGQTTVGDGVQLLERLKPETRKLFEDSPIKYVMIHPADRWQAIFQTDDLAEVETYCKSNDWTMRVTDDGAIETEYVAPAIHTTKYGGQQAFVNNVIAILRWEWAGVPTRKVRMPDGSKLPQEVIDDLWATEERVTHEVDWQPGDLLVVDNTRFMHGRRKFSDLSREIYVRMGAGLRG